MRRRSTVDDVQLSDSKRPNGGLVHAIDTAESMTARGLEGVGLVADAFGSDPARPDAATDKALVDQVLADLKANFEKWEAVLAAQESVTFTADVGDIYATCNSDGRLTGLSLASHVMTSYTCRELMDRLNMVFEALREEAQADFSRNYGGGVVE
jgi:hypothetical protein